nr:NAD(P)-dependent oxidoreductase [Haladaptatus sp. W1]
MARIAVTGASGNVGAEVIEAFDDHDLTLITHSERDDMESIPLDVTNRDAFIDALSDEDVLIHLAANPSPYADWDDLHRVNIEGTYNAYEAAVENGLDRVVYASSNHAVNGNETVAPDEPETLREETPAVSHDARPHPDSWYGVTKGPARPSALDSPVRAASKR